MTRFYRLCLVLALAWTLIPRAHAEEYITVESASLKSNPQTYWARGIVFSDVLESIPGGKSVKLGERSYLPIQTRILGTCYIDASLEDAVKQLKLGEEYVFAGSVYQKDSGIIFSKRRFYVVIKRVSAAIKKTGDLAPALQEALARSLAEGPYAATLQNLNGLLASAQKELQAYCASSNLDIKAVFEPGSPHAHRAQQTVRQALFELENRTKTPTAEYAVSLVTTFLAVQNGALAPAPAPVPVEPPALTNEPAVAPTVEVLPVEPAAEPEPAPISETPAVEVVAPEAEPATEPEAVPVEPIPEATLEPVVEPAPEAAVLETPVVVETEAMAAPAEAQPEPTPAEAPLAEPLPIEEPIVTEAEAAADEGVRAPPAIAEPVMEEAPTESPAVIEPPLIDAPAEAATLPAEPVAGTVPTVEAESTPAVRPSSSLPAAKLKLSLEPEEELAPAPESPKETKSSKRKAGKSKGTSAKPDPDDAVPLR